LSNDKIDAFRLLRRNGILLHRTGITFFHVDSMCTAMYETNPRSKNYNRIFKDLGF
jgi:hypothetical protein